MSVGTYIDFVFSPADLAEDVDLDVEQRKQILFAHGNLAALDPLAALGPLLERQRRPGARGLPGENGITPESIRKNIGELLSSVYEHDYVAVPPVEEAEIEARYRSLDDLEAEVKALEKQMREAAKALEFERAAEIRDRLRKLRAREFGLR